MGGTGKTGKGGVWPLCSAGMKELRNAILTPICHTWQPRQFGSPSTRFAV